MQQELEKKSMNWDIKTILILFDRDHRIISANDNLFQVSGYTYETIVRKPFSFLFPDALSNLPFEFQHNPIFLVAANKEKYPVHGIVCSIPHDPFPNQWALIGSIALQMQNTFFVKRCLTCAGVVHDINNLLTAAYAAMSFMELEQLPKDILAQIKTIGQALHAINDLTIELGRTIKDDRTDIAPCSIIDIIRNALHLAVSGLPAIKTDLVCSENIPRVMGHEKSLFRTFHNIFTNACEAMNNEGKIDIEITSYVPSPSGLTQKEMIQVKITDSGPGIRCENVSSIFSPFVSSKGKTRGLGLYVVKSIVEKHGGTITINQNPLQGATFVVKLPLYANAT